MVLSIRRTKNQNQRKKLKKLKIYLRLSREKMKLLNAQLLIVQNIFIRSALNNMMSRNFSNILTLTRCILDARFIIAMPVESVEILCPSFNVLDVLKHYTQDAWTNKK
jgi:hypothetical protein